MLVIFLKSLKRMKGVFYNLSDLSVLISGKTCPYPSSLPFGSWTCELQDVPVRGTSFLDNDAPLYPSEYGLYCLSANSILHCYYITFPSLHICIMLVAWRQDTGFSILTGWDPKANNGDKLVMIC